MQQPPSDQFWRPPQVDLAIIAALAEEFDGLLTQLSTHWRIFQIEGTLYRYATIAFGQHTLHVVVLTTPEMGGDMTVSAVRRVELTLRPRLMIMVGLCAGVGKSRIGDVLVAEVSVNPRQGGKANDQGVQLDLRTQGIPNELLKELRTYVDSSRFQAQKITVIHQQPEGEPGSEKDAAAKSPVTETYQPCDRIGVFGQSDMVLAVNEPTRLLTGKFDLTDIVRKLVAIDMEMDSFYTALNDSNPPLWGFGVKGVSDLAGPTKNDEYREPALRNTIAWLQGFLTWAWPNLLKIIPARPTARLSPERWAQPYPGHEGLCNEVVELLNHPGQSALLVVHGAKESGRARLADAIADRLDTAGLQRMPQMFRYNSTPMHTIDDFLQSVAASLPIATLHQFLLVNARWLGRQTYAMLRTLLLQRIEIEIPAQTLAPLPPIARIPHTKITPEWIDQLAIALAQSLRQLSQPAVLLLDHSQAAHDLRQLIQRLLSRLGILALPVLVIANQPLSDERGRSLGQQRQIPRWTQADIRRYCATKLKEYAPELLEWLEQQSHGMPELVEILLSNDHLTRLDAAQQRAWLKTQLHSDFSGLQELFDSYEMPIQRLLALDGLIAATGVPQARDQEMRATIMPTLRANMAKLLLHDLAASQAPQVTVDQLIADWIADYEMHYVNYGTLQKIGYSQFKNQRALLLREWSRALVGIFDQWLRQAIIQPDPLLFANYWLRTSELETARQRLLPLLNDSTLAFGTHCADPFDLIIRLRNTDRAFNAGLSSLAGDLALAWGHSETAQNMYDLALADLPPKDPHYLAVVGQLMRTYQLTERAGSSVTMRQHAQQLLEQCDVPYARTFITAWHTIAQSELAETEEAFLQSTTELGQLVATIAAQALPPGDESIYRHEQAYLVDALAKMEVARGRYPEATKLLSSMRQSLSEYPLLQARFENNLGFVSYYKLGQTNPLTRNYFRRALEKREQFGDRVGAVRSAANLIGVWLEAALGVKEWGEIEQFSLRHLERAQQLNEVTAAQRLQLNLLELYLRRGDFGPARVLLDTALVATDRPPAALLIQDAWWHLWQQHYAECVATLARITEILAHNDDPEDQWEWAQIVFELALHERMHGTSQNADKLLPTAQRILDGNQQYEDSPRATAQCAYTRGLGLLAVGDAHEALAAFTICDEAWAKERNISHPYRAACTAIWMTFCQHQLGDPRATESAHLQASARLTPFGETPARQLLEQVML